MRRSTLLTLLSIAALTAFGAYVAWPGERDVFGREARVVRGLDLQGGLQVLLRAREGQNPSADSMNVARQIIESRVNGLGVSEPVVQRQGDDSIVVELPGVDDPEQAIETLGNTGLLEFVDVGAQPLPEGQRISTDYRPRGAAAQPGRTPAAGSTAPANETPAAGGTPPALTRPEGTVQPIPTGTAAAAPQQTAEPAAPAPGAEQDAATGPVYHTVMSGDQIQGANVGLNEAQQPVVQFQLKDEGARIFGDFTTRNVGRYLAIVLDKEVVSSPSINSPITGGQGEITGQFTQAEAQSLALQLRYGSLPVEFEIASSSTVGATLGQDSVSRSITAGTIGVLAVALFMILYYRLPGIVSVVALAIYAVLTFALFKLIPVTLTLAGIAGFVLSIGMAVDANVLIFARMKEELRRGRNLVQAVEGGFRNAWPSIRDSNVSTLITCAILAWFGSTFGASIIRGFAITLALGVLVSMFTAIVTTRSLMRLVVRIPAVHRIWLWGVARDEVRAAPAAPGRGGALGAARSRPDGS